MSGGRKIDRRGSGPLWFIMLAVALFALYSIGVALSSGDCPGSRSWNFFPPKWECDATPGFG